MGDDDDYLKALEIQRKNFEKQFGNLEDMGFVDKSKVQESELSEESDSASESDGDSDVEDQRSEDESSNEDESESEIESLSEEEVKPKVVRLEGDSPAPAIASKEERKLLRKGRAPTIVSHIFKNRQR